MAEAIDNMRYRMEDEVIATYFKPEDMSVAAQCSIAISLKRIADKLEQTSWPVENGEAFQTIHRG